MKSILDGLPVHDFNCRLIYYTPAGHRRHFYGKTRAVMADIALEIAERQLKADKRRRVARVSYGEAIQQ